MDLHNIIDNLRSIANELRAVAVGSPTHCEVLGLNIRRLDEQANMLEIEVSPVAPRAAKEVRSTPWHHNHHELKDCGCPLTAVAAIRAAELELDEDENVVWVPASRPTPDNAWSAIRFLISAHNWSWKAADKRPGAAATPDAALVIDADWKDSAPSV